MEGRSGAGADERAVKRISAWQDPFRYLSPGLRKHRTVRRTEDQIKGAPKFTRSTDWDWSDRARDCSVYYYYRTPLRYESFELKRPEARVVARAFTARTPSRALDQLERPLRRHLTRGFAMGAKPS